MHNTCHVREAAFDVSAWLKRLGDGGTVTVLHQRATDERPYEVANAVLKDGVVTWTFDATDTSVPGYGKAAVLYKLNGEYRAKSVPFMTCTEETIGESGVDPPPGPEPYEGPYEVTPSEETQTLATQGLLLTDDVTIAPIPSNYGKITWNGTYLRVS